MPSKSRKKPAAPFAGTFIPCTLRQLPAELHADAARTAIEVNPANRPAGPVPVARIGAFTSKYWGAKGVKLGVAFLDATPSDLAARLIAHMNAWAQNGKANVTFAQSTSGQAEVRLSRTPGDGYWSYLGTDILHIPRGEPTMNLDSFSMQTSESEYRRVVRHETGHTLGFPHEHLRRALVARLDEAKTIAYFGRTQGWTPDEVRQQVLTPIEEASLLTPTPEDETSIMCYQLSGSITKDGRPIPGGTDIDANDAAYCVRIYPGASLPPTPPPPPPPPSANDVLSLRLGARQVSAFLNPDKTVVGTWS